MSLFSRKKTPPVVPPVVPPPSRPKPETILKLDLPNVFAYQENATRSTPLSRQSSVPGSEPKPEHVRGTVLLVESDDEIRRLLSRLLQHEGFLLLNATCLAEAREILKERPVDFVLARRTCVPLNLETDLALRDVRQKAKVRIVDDFSDLILGQVVDYESMSQCTLALSGLLVSLLEGVHTNARGHAQTVAKYCRLVGQRLAMRRRDLDAMTLAATLHDLGPLETEHRISDPGIESNPSLQTPSLQSTLELLANVPFAYPINDLLAATTENAALPDTESLPAAPLGARILHVVEAYDTLRRNHVDQFADETQLFNWMRRQPAGTFDLDALETLIHIRKNERAINGMDLFREIVLLVDPHPEELKPLIHRLQNDDYQILTARSLADAVHQLQTQHVTLVLTENMLQGKSTGLELLCTIKNDPAMRDIPVIFHTTSQTDFIRQALELGAEDWYPKLHNVEIVSLKISRILRRFRARPAVAGVPGNLLDMTLLDMVQILCDGNRSVQIQLQHNDVRAELLIHKGHIYNASHRNLEGETAALKVLRWREGNFLIRPLREEPPIKITTTTDSLLLQSCAAEAHRKANSP